MTDEQISEWAGAEREVSSPQQVGTGTQCSTVGSDDQTVTWTLEPSSGSSWEQFVDDATLEGGQRQDIELPGGARGVVIRVDDSHLVTVLATIGDEQYVNVEVRDMSYGNGNLTMNHLAEVGTQVAAAYTS